jgi:hypothetical protein
MNLEQLFYWIRDLTTWLKTLHQSTSRFFNYSLINIHAPTNDSEEEAKDQFYEQLERAACPGHDVKLVMGDAKVGRETVHQPTRGKHSLHESTNENGLRLVDFGAGRQMAIKSTYSCTNKSTSALPR